MKRIIIHWTGGVYEPNTLEFNHYHYLVNGNGLIFEGKYSPKDNLCCTDGEYAAHTGGGNTGSIGIALCGMLDYKSPDNVGQFPLTKVQCERAFKLIAKLSKRFDIKITTQTVMTHYEFGLKNPNTESAGKIDINYLPPYPWLKPEEVGNFIRNKARWYYKIST